MTEDITAQAGLHNGSRILEIGCGTGQLTRELARRGFSLLALEPGPDLAALARRNCSVWPGVRIEVSILEDWSPGKHRFDLVVAAQSFHLVDPARRFDLVARVLEPGGALAVVWSYRMAGESAAHGAVDRAYREFAPEHSPWQDLMDTPFEDVIQGSGLFGPVTVRTYHWCQEYSSAGFVGLLTSLGTLQNVARRGSLYDAVRAGIDAAGGTITIGYLTRLYVAPMPGRAP